MSGDREVHKIPEHPRDEEEPEALQALASFFTHFGKVRCLTVCGGTAVYPVWRRAVRDVAVRCPCVVSSLLCFLGACSQHRPDASAELRMKLLQCRQSPKRVANRVCMRVHHI